MANIGCKRVSVHVRDPFAFQLSVDSSRLMQGHRGGLQFCCISVSCTNVAGLELFKLLRSAEFIGHVIDREVEDIKV